MSLTDTRSGLLFLRRRFRQQHLLRRTLLEPAMWIDVVLLLLLFVILNSS